MHSEVIKFLSKYNSDVQLVNKLLVSLFIKAKGLIIKNNRFIKRLLFSESDPDNEVFKDFVALFKRYEDKFDFGELIQLFEHTIPQEDKIINGIVYTPKYIKNVIVDEVFERLQLSPSQSTFCDLACGCGGFLYTIAKKIKKETKKNYVEIFKENLFGLDIKDYSIERAKILLSLLAISEGEECENFDFNLSTGNALDFDWFKEFSIVHQNNGFDAIVGNPPYVTLRHIDNESRRLLKNWTVTKGGNTDLYIPFFEIGINYLKKEGILGYITVNTFFRSLNARTLRKYFHVKSFDFKIIDFGNEQIFGNKSTYTCLCFIQKHSCDHIKYTKATVEQIQSNKRLEFNRINYDSLNYSRGWLLCPSPTLNKLRKIETAGISLVKRFKMRTGLATLANHLYIFKPCKEDEDFYYVKRDEIEFPIEKGICKDIINPNKIKSNTDISTHIEKIIFPYHKYNNNVELFPEDFFKTHFLQAYKYLEVHRSLLDKRDKGKGKYQNWYAFGRNQSLSDSGLKLLFPHITTQLRFIFTNYLDLLFYNGHAIYSDSKEELLILKAILESDVFKFYISHSSKPYTNGYFSLSKNYIKHFTICELSSAERSFLLNCKEHSEINDFLQRKYNLR